MKFEVGKVYKTYGGWKAKIIWEIYNCDNFEWEGNARYYVIHKPTEQFESAVIVHKKDGKAVSTLSVSEPPQYETNLPADLKEEWK